MAQQPRFGIQQKLVSVVLALLISIGAFVAMFFPLRQKAQMTKYLDEKVRVTAQMIAFNASTGVAFEDAVAVKSTLDVLPTLTGVKFAVIVNTAGQEIASFKPDNSFETLQSEIKSALQSSDKQVQAVKDVALYVEPIVYQGTANGKVIVGISLAELSSDAEQSRFIAIGIGVGILVLGGIVILFVSARIVRPLKTLSRAAEQVAGGNFEASVSIHTKDEVEVLANAFNGMVQNIKRAINFIEKSSRAEEMARKAEEARHALQEQQQHLQNSAIRILDAMERFANGDIAVQLPIGNEKDDVMNKISIGFNNASANIGQLIEDVVDAAHAVANISANISAHSESMAAGAQNQMMQVQRISDEISDMVDGIEESSSRAVSAAQESNEASNDAQRGGSVVREAILGMNAISEVVGESVETVQALGESSKQIGAIIRVIADIADQTNLLALNAAIEAARAGDQGRGFAVVADEVRKLAERTQTATKEISATITRIQGDTRQVVKSMQASVQNVEQGKLAAAKASEALERIITRTAAVAESINALAGMSKSLTERSNNMNTIVDDIKRVTRQSSELTAATAQGASDLNESKDHLMNSIQNFNI